ncbi:hypothetical protein Taro_044225 [Colocasia esculenta]|uniref:porphobilinogen synthase n=1 Tax=Colocasia esculenta TaxID=4460 RepID=A0A843WTH1_COLES|nr:hypothetical protein [Colocasia esculenta]
MNSVNYREALVETHADVAEGADILLVSLFMHFGSSFCSLKVKPALPYLDVIRLPRENSALPIAAYQAKERERRSGCLRRGLPCPRLLPSSSPPLLGSLRHRRRWLPAPPPPLAPCADAATGPLGHHRRRSLALWPPPPLLSVLSTEGKEGGEAHRRFPCFLS